MDSDRQTEFSSFFGVIISESSGTERRFFFFFLHTKPFNKDIYNHIQCPTALL